MVTECDKVNDALKDRQIVSEKTEATRDMHEDASSLCLNVHTTYMTQEQINQSQSNATKKHSERNT